MKDMLGKKICQLARHSIEHYLKDREVLKPNKRDYSEELFGEERGVFVTLKKNGNLRGCIGNIQPIKDVLSAVVDNAVAAAFRDPRFPALRKDELKDLDIEVSILTRPSRLKYESVGDLISKLVESKPGVIVKKGFNTATYLPSVWDQLSDVKEFMNNLCLKAGLSSDEWVSGDLDILVYEAHVYGDE